MRRLTLVALLFGCGATLARAADVATPTTAPSAGRNTVVWISLDGFRGDYVDRAPLPFFHKMMAEGAYTRRLTPITPSLTFASHVAEATGTTADVNGIPGNSFFDQGTHTAYSFPAESSLLRAEPIWVTAERQGVRALVYDWPLGQHQTGLVRASYFLLTFDAQRTDRARVDALLKTWDEDEQQAATTRPTTAAPATQPATVASSAERQAPLRLVMGYVEATDPAGHKFGPDSPQVTDAAVATDALLSQLCDRAIEKFKAHAGPGDQLYFLVTTDHGMDTVRTLVNLKYLFSPLPTEAVRLTTTGNEAFIDLGRLPETDRAATRDAMLQQLKAYDFLTAYTPETLPPQWHLNAAGRVGDVLVMLKPGYAFATALPQATFPPGKVKAPLGMHGYPPSDDPKMLGFAAVWRYPTPLGGVDLGTAKTLQLHPTVARWLGIDPSPQARAEAIDVGR